MTIYGQLWRLAENSPLDLNLCRKYSENGCCTFSKDWGILSYYWKHHHFEPNNFWYQKLIGQFKISWQWRIQRFFGNTVYSRGFWGKSPKGHNSELWRIISSYKHVWMTWVGVIYYGKCNYYVLIDCIWHCVRGKFIQNYFDFSNFLLIWCKNLESHIGWPNSHTGWQNSSESFLLFLFQSIILPYTNYFYHIVRCFLIMSFISIHSIFVVLFFFFFNISADTMFLLYYYLTVL